MKFKITLICVVQLFGPMIFQRAMAAEITFVKPQKSFYVVGEDRGGRAFSIRNDSRKLNTEFTQTVPDNLCESSLFWVCVDEAVSWMKFAKGDKIRVWQENGRIMSSGSDQQPINNYLSDWTQVAYVEIPNALIQRIDFMSAQSAGVKRPFQNPETLFSEQNLNRMENLYPIVQKQLIAAKLADKKFVEQQKSRILLQWIELYCQASLTAGSDFEIPERFYIFLDKVNFDSDFAADYPGISDVLKAYFTSMYRNGRITYEAGNYLSKRAELLKNQRLIEMYVLDELNIAGRNGWTYRLDEVIDNARKLLTTDEAKTKFAKLHQELEKSIAENNRFVGQECPEFEFEDRNGNVVKLSDFKGRYVFVDIWATWCAPCKYEIPYLMQLERELHGKNIEFISLSVDKATDKQVWLNYITDNHMDGVCLIAPEAFSHPMIKRFGVNSIPRFLLFDTEGKIISVRNRRPHDPIMKQQLIDLVTPLPKNDKLYLKN